LLKTDQKPERGKLKTLIKYEIGTVGGAQEFLSGAKKGGVEGIAGEPHQQQLIMEEIDIFIWQHGQKGDAWKAQKIFR